jgi:hypothetical protein
MRGPDHMVGKILFNIASRQRVTAFYELLDNISATSASDNYVILAKIDNDDPYLSEYIEHCEVKKVMRIVSDCVSKIDAINRSIPTTDWDIIVNVSDDQRFTVKGFDDIIRHHIKDKGFLHFRDNYKRAACSVMSIMSREYYEEQGYIYHPDYYSLWADMEATQIAKLKNDYKYIATPIADHNHYSTTGIEKDSLYKRNDTYKRDRVVYEKRKSTNFDIPGDYPFLLIKYPTRGRWRLFAAAIDNIYSTIRTHRFHIQVTADTDDVEMNSPEVRELVKRYPNVSIAYGLHKDKVHACNEGMATDWDWCLLMSDDMAFTRFGWDMDMWKSIRSVWPDGTDFFAHFNDGYVGDKLPTMNICGREYYDRFGYLYHPSYSSVSCDAENMFVAKMLGRYHYFDDVYFNHVHPANLK